MFLSFVNPPANLFHGTALGTVPLSSIIGLDRAVSLPAIACWLRQRLSRFALKGYTGPYDSIQCRFPRGEEKKPFDHENRCA